MNRIPLPALIITTLTAALLAVLAWTMLAAPDTSPPELPTLTAPAPVDPYPGPDPYPPPPTVGAPYPGPYPAPYPGPVYLPAVLDGEGAAYP